MCVRVCVRGEFARAVSSLLLDLLCVRRRNALRGDVGLCSNEFVVSAVRHCDGMQRNTFNVLLSAGENVEGWHSFYRPKAFIQLTLDGRKASQ